MSGREDTLRSQMVREAEGAIDELLRGAGQQGRDLTLTDIEQLVRKAGQRVMERLTECMVEAEAEKRGSLSSMWQEDGLQGQERAQPSGRDGRNPLGAGLLLLQDL